MKNHRRKRQVNACRPFRVFTGGELGLSPEGPAGGGGGSRHRGRRSEVGQRAAGQTRPGGDGAGRAGWGEANGVRGPGGDRNFSRSERRELYVALGAIGGSEAAIFKEDSCGHSTQGRLEEAGLGTAVGPAPVAR